MFTVYKDLYKILLLFGIFLTVLMGFKMSVAAEGAVEMLSQGKHASASSNQAGNEDYKANDGFIGTRWAAASGTMPQWWKVDLEKVYYLSKLKAGWYDSANRYFQYKIETSTDDITYTLVVDKTGNTAKGDSTDVFSAYGRYVRVTVTGTSIAAGYASAYEFNVYGLAGNGGVGSVKPWIMYQGAAADTNGSIRKSTVPGNIAYEAYNRDYVELSATGHFVKYKATVPANRITIRYSIPRGSPDGTISLYINDVHRTDVAVTAKRTWNEKSEVPGGYCRYFDEVTISQDVNIDDVIMLKKDNGDNLPAYAIDFIELENAPGPLTMPATGYVSVQAYGKAAGNGITDDATAIINTLNYAKANSKSVWIDAGNYRIGRSITIPENVKVCGAGIWYSTVTRSFYSESSPGPTILLSGGNTVKDFTVTDANANIRANSNEGIKMNKGGSGFTIENMFVSYAYGAGIYGSIVTNSSIKNCRVRGTYADSIHLCDASHDNEITGNSVRNAGDDGIAIVSYDEEDNGNHSVTYNTVECNYWGRGMSITGGHHNAMLYNEVTDSAWAAGILICVENYNNQISPYNTDFSVKNNKIIRCGQALQDQYGALWVYGGVDREMSGEISNNTISESVRNPISLKDYVDDTVIITNNTIEPPGPNGKAVWTSLKPGHNPVVTRTFYSHPAAFTYKSSSGQAVPLLSDASGGSVKGELSIYNYTGSAKQAILIMALYNENGKLVSVDTDAKNISSGLAIPFYAVINVPSGMPSGYTVKTFVWENLFNAQPLPF